MASDEPVHVINVHVADLFDNSAFYIPHGAESLCVSFHRAGVFYPSYLSHVIQPSLVDRVVFNKCDLGYITILTDGHGYLSHLIIKRSAGWFDPRTVQRYTHMPAITLPLLFDRYLPKTQERRSCAIDFHFPQTPAHQLQTGASERQQIQSSMEDIVSVPGRWGDAGFQLIDNTFLFILDIT